MRVERDGVTCRPVISAVLREAVASGRSVTDAPLNQDLSLFGARVKPPVVRDGALLGY